jgi:acetyl esterase/lipase
VAATDYPGLGTAGTHPYLVGISEGRAVLDSVRAARRLTSAQAGSNFAVWGHSQGGQASLFTGQLAASYAPELKLAGVAAAAPATELARLLDDDIKSDGGKVLTAFALWSWNRVFGAPLAPVLDPSAEPAVYKIAGECIENVFQDLGVAKSEAKLNKDFLHGDVTQTEPWKSLLARNSTGGAPAGAPVFIAQGTADTTVRPQVTYEFARDLCQRGALVELVWMPGVNHGMAAQASAKAAVNWMAGRLDGVRAPDQCRNLPAEPKGKPKPS